VEVIVIVALAWNAAALVLAVQTWLLAATVIAEPVGAVAVDDAANAPPAMVSVSAEAMMAIVPSLRMDLSSGLDTER
jgi:hypothetical protein